MLQSRASTGGAGQLKRVWANVPGPCHEMPAHLVRSVNALDGALALEMRHSAVRRHCGPDRRAGAVGRELLGGGEGAVVCGKRVARRDWGDRPNCALP
eukprot:scaffold110287_cov58-Phaeocystis_antarctica.AAC.1